ncbi:MAG: C25 family cysteine peptidase [Blastocatellia bacterium]
MKRQPLRPMRRTMRSIRTGAALMLALALLGLGYYRIVAAQKDAGTEWRVEVEILPGESAKVIDVTSRPLVPVVIYGNAGVAAASLQAASVAVAGAPPTKRAKGQLRAELRDVNGDGYDDLLVSVAARSLRLGDGDQSIIVTASTIDGQRVSGTTKATIQHARPLPTSPHPDGMVFTNSGPITINDGGSPPTTATPYPSTINVSGLSGNVAIVTVTLTNLSHSFPDDIDILLVGPTGANALILSDVGGGTAASNVTLTLSDNAGGTLPDNGPLMSGTFKPTNIGTGAGDNFPSPAPVPTGNALLSTFNGTDPNGTWKLYVVDDNTSNAGTIAGGWSLNILTSSQSCNPANIDINDSHSPPTTATPYPSQINVAGLTGGVSKVTVDLRDLTHTFSDDIDILLVGPTGATAVIMSDAGGSWMDTDLNLTFDDNAAAPLPDEPDTGPMTSGTYRPGNYDTTPDSWPGVPTPSASSALSVFNGTNPNGTWSLYIVDDEDGDSGNIGGGWCLNIATGDPTLARMSSQSATVNQDGRVAIEWNASYESDNLGFNVYREEGGQRQRVNREMIAGSALFAGQGIGLTTGRSYRCFDQLTPGGRTARYWIEAIGLDGSSDWHGPFTAAYVPGANLDAPSPLLEELGGQRGDHESNGGNFNISAAPAVAQGTATALKLYVQQAGMYHVTQAELLAAGLSPDVDPRRLQLYEDGRERPITVPGEADGRFDVGDAVEFYATAPDSAYTTARVYWLVAGSQPGQRIKRVKSKGFAEGAASYQAMAELRERSVYFAVLRNGERENFFGAAVGGNGVTRSLRLSNVVATAPATLEVTMQGMTLMPHRVNVMLNGEAVGDLAFESQAAAALRVNLPPAKLREGDNDIQLIAGGGSTDVSLIDTIRISYERGYRADGDALACTAQAKAAVTLSGFSSAELRVMDVTEAEKGGAREVAATVRHDKSGYNATVSAPGEGTRQLLAFTAAQMRRPAAIVADRPSNWRQPANAADLVIITRGDMESAFAPLKAWRERQGYKVALVDVEDLYDEFSYGQKTPQAIKDFLAYAAGNWQTVPRYVVIGGDASYDPKNYLRLGEADVVPTKLIDTSLMETASDDWYAEMGSEGLAAMAVGRLPVRSATEAAALVAKIIAYDGAAPSDALLLVADSSDDFDFAGAANQLRDFIPSNVRAEEIRRGQTDDVASRERLLAAINEGRKVVNYLGHGNIDQLHGFLLTDADARALTNQERLTFFVAMTCLNGYFQEPALDSLAEAMVKAPHGGAVAAWASSGMSGPAEQVVVNQALFRYLFSSGATLGDATLKAKAATSSSDVRRTWILLGDPTTRLR